MKKRSLMAFVLIVTLLLAGCGAEEERVGGSITPVEETTEAAVQETIDETTQETTQESAPPKKENEFALGSMAGGVYENPYVGYGCALDSSWSYKTAEELQDISDLTEQLLEGSEIDQLGDFTNITDMMAENAELMVNMNVLYSYLTPQQRITHAMMTEEDLIDATLAQKDLLISSYAQAGIEVSSMEKVTVTFLGEERFAIHTSAAIQDVSYYVLQLFDINLGQYYVTLTLGSFGEDNTGTILDLFYPLS